MLISTARARRRMTWIPLVAMLGFALLPAISRAMAFASGGSGWVEVCTPQGMEWVSPEGERAKVPPAGTAPTLDHCHFCQLVQDGGAPLPASAAAPVLTLGGAEPPRLFLQAAHTLAAWRSAQPRAPPVLA